MTLSNLIHRLETAEGPDRHLDALILCEAAPDKYRNYSPVDAYLEAKRTVYGTDVWATETAHTSSFESYPALTASIDATLALIEEVLPGWCCDPSIELPDPRSGYAGNCEVLLWNEGKGQVYKTAQSSHKSPAIALLIALLKALQAKEAGDV